MKVIRPYIPDAAFEWLQEWITPDMRVFEYGSGTSTMWFGQNVAEVVAVENCEPYFKEIQESLTDLDITNVTYVFRDGAEYYNHIYEYDEPFDLVFVDGRFRKECMIPAYDMAKHAILLDNSDASHYLDAYKVMQSYSGGQIQDFTSFGIWPATGELLKTPKADEGEPLAWKASVFLRDVKGFE
jgi:16S rRNA G966 N2-methylase RsmD